ncbi:MFS transporter [Siccirubricoccus sp. G192]|nr:MFS transporter [Siccirubricoccus sp. G192]
MWPGWAPSSPCRSWRPPIAAETGLPASLAGVHTALVYAGALLSGPLAQGLLRRFGGIRVCQGSLLVIAAGIALAVLGHPLALAASAVVGGIGHGPLTPAGSHLLAARTPARIRSLVFGLKQCGVPAGAMLVAFLAPLLGAAFGWRWGVLGVAALAVALALALQPLRAVLDADRDPTATRAAPWREAMASLALLRTERRLRAVTLVCCGLGISQFSFFSFFVVWQVQMLGTPLVEAGMRLAAGQAAGIAGRILWALLADRIGAGPVLRALGLGTAASAAGLALAGPDWPGLAILVLAVAMGATAVGWNGLLLAEVARVAPPGRVGAATAAMGFAFGITMLFAPSLFSLAVGLTGDYRLGFGLCAVMALLAVAVLRRG